LSNDLTGKNCNHVEQTKLLTHAQWKKQKRSDRQFATFGGLRTHSDLGSIRIAVGF
jgi:hypothetical protein